jgi:simple sugar transport system ATP-binding protein
VVFISHKLNEVLEVSDTITVLRGGRHVVTRPAQGATARELARLMTGAEDDLTVEHREHTGEIVLELRGVEARNARGLTALHGIDLMVCRGEVMGIAGVSGNGQTELAEVVTSLRRVERGTVSVCAQDVTNASSRTVADAGVGHIPEDRIGVGMVKSASVKSNAVMRHYRTPELSKGFQLNLGAIAGFARRLVESARVQTRSIEAPAGQMSGGNQQRLVARRESLVAENLLVAAHPTRGLDVLATQEVQQSLLERRDQGCAVLLISDDLDEVLLLSDRVAVMYEGRIMGVFDRVDFDRERIGLLMGGHVEAATEVGAP